MPNPLTALASMGITTVEELQALITLFSHQQREVIPENMRPSPQPGPATPHWNDQNVAVDNAGYPIDYTIAANNLTKDYGQGVATGKRNVWTNNRP